MILNGKGFVVVYMDNSLGAFQVNQMLYVYASPGDMSFS